MSMERLRTSLADRYRIERELGAGGMATVYLAEDLRHKRKVAIKVLKPELAAVLGAERFLIEITTTAALQHPHILPLFDSGNADGFLFYVMPFIDGETLRAKLDRETQLGIDEAVRIASNVADALDYAHRQGVIHRDIKPENILLHEGRPMVADFGIALALSAAAGGRMTETGMSLGTPHYMSPEQATAEKEISGRSDIYSLGSVLYEMLAGQPPHLGGSAQQIIMKIIAEPIAPVTTHRKSVPVNVAAAIDKALEKLPADRFGSAKEFAAALADTGFRGTTVHRSGIVAAAGGWRERAAVPALVGIGVLVIGLAWTLRRPSLSGPVSRYVVGLADGQRMSAVPWGRLAVSPDGAKLAYIADDDRGTIFLLRSRGDLQATPIPGTEGGINPAFSPNGTRIAFMDRVGGGTIKVVSIEGGPATIVTDSLVGAPGVAWGPDGYIYYDRGGVGPLMRAPENGGAAESVGQLDSTRGELQHSWPDVLPNGKGVIVTVGHSGPGEMGGTYDEIGVLDLRTRKHRVLVRGVLGRYARGGYLLFVTAEGALMGARFDQEKMELTGEPVKLFDGVNLRTGNGAADLALSAEGTLWYTAGGVDAGGTREVVWVDRTGAATPVAAGWSGLFSAPALSPDGKKVAVLARALDAQVLIRDLQQGTLSRLTLDGTYNAAPAWRADGRTVAFVTQRGTDRQLWERVADGSRPTVPLLDDPRSIEDVSFSRDGAWILYRSGSSPEQTDIFARRIGTDSSIPLLTSPANESSPAVSPDGRWLAYVSDESGSPKVYVSPFPNVADRRSQVSTDGGQEPVWSRSGRELFYRVAGTGIPQQMVVEVPVGTRFSPGSRRALFPLPRFLMSNTRTEYAVSPDDRRFLMVRNTESGRTDRLVVVEHFDQELRTRLAPR